MSDAGPTRAGRRWLWRGLWLGLRRGLRRGLIGAAAFVGLLGLAVAALWVALPRYDWGPFAARRASAALGRTVTIGALHVSPGRWLGLEANTLDVANVPGGTAPAMATVRRLVAELDLLSLLHGPLVLRGVMVEGAELLLEHGDRPPWDPAAPIKAPDLAGLPSVRSAQVSDSGLTIVTTSGAALLLRLDQGTVRSETDEAPFVVEAGGVYQGVPLKLTMTLQSLAAMRRAPEPVAAEIVVVSEDTSLVFKGTLTDPVGLDGARGRLALDAPTLGPVFGVAGLEGGPELSLRLEGRFEHTGLLWLWEEATGLLEHDRVRSATVRFTEGRPDDVQVALTFETLDLNALFGEGQRGKKRGADIPIGVDAAPDTLVRLRVEARELSYGSLVMGQAVLAGALQPGRVAVEELAVTLSGARVRAAGRVEAGGRMSAEGGVAGAEVGALRRLLGIGPVPIEGRVGGAFTLAATGPSLNQAMAGARVSGVVHMERGAIAREVVEMASSDVRALFRTARGTTPVGCLRLGVDMRAGVGTLAPMRVRAAEGTIAGSGRFDLRRQTMDVTIGSESRSTGFFALDIPVRVSGSFASPSVSPATWSPQGRAALAAADSLSALPPSLRAEAQRHPCPASR